MTSENWDAFLEYLQHKELEEDYGARILLTGIRHYLSEFSRPLIHTDINLWKEFNREGKIISLMLDENNADKRRKILSNG